MANRSRSGGILLFLILLVVCIGFYFTVGAIRIFKHRETVLVNELRGLHSDIGRLTEAVKELTARGGIAIPQEGEGTRRPRFANLQARDPDAVDGDQIVIGELAGTGSLNYIINNEYLAGTCWGLAFDSAAERNLEDPSIFEPKLATSWEISEDKMNYTIHLRPGVFWHDFTDPTTGERFENVEVTAEDFKFYMDIIKNPGIECEPARGSYEDLDRIEVIDKYTFKVYWKKRYFRSEGLTLGLNPLPRHFYRFEKAEEFNENHKRNRMLVGCGAWVFESWEKGKEIVFRRNENYYAPKPYLKKIRIRIITEPLARFQALRSGDIDYLERITPEQWINQTDDEEFKQKLRKHRYPRWAYYYIGYNIRKELFADTRVRVAMTHLVDREKILKDVYFGLGRTVTNNFFIDGAYYDESIKPYPFDVEKAKDLLAEAGWEDTDDDGVLDKDGKPFEFTFLIRSGSAISSKIASIVKEDFAKAGVIANISSLEWSVFLERIEEWNFDVVNLGWGMAWDPDPYQLWHSSQADLKKSSNHIGFKSEEVDQIIMEAREEFDLQKRIKLYHRLARILHEEQPYTFLTTPDDLLGIDKRFRNARIYVSGMDINSLWVPEEEQKYRD